MSYDQLCQFVKTLNCTSLTDWNQNKNKGSYQAAREQGWQKLIAEELGFPSQHRHGKNGGNKPKKDHIWFKKAKAASDKKEYLKEKYGDSYPHYFRNIR
jgi:hypothetical protein